VKYDYFFFCISLTGYLGRECIIPDVSRTYHFGAKGVHINPRFQDSYFRSHALNTEKNIKFDVDKITKEGYEENIIPLIKYVICILTFFSL